MELAQFNAVCNAIQAVGTVATPLVVAILGARYIHRQAIHETVLSEKAKHYSVISPLLNQIYSYRLMVGDFLERSPEEILQAKRSADHEFWTFSYIWSTGFIENYKAFMDECFSTFDATGTKALINAESKYYPVKPAPKTCNADGKPWPGFAERPVDKWKLMAIYRRIGDAISKDMKLSR